jgi:CHASE2 domain-containing sensor protein
MDKIALLKIGRGDFEQGFEVSLQLWEAEGSLLGTWEGALPPHANLESLYFYWLHSFRNLTARAARRRSEPDDDDDLRPDPSFVTNRAESEDCEACRQWMQQLERQMQDWLQNSDRGWQKIRERLARELASDPGSLRLVIQTSNLQLWRLPWHVWDLLDDYPQVGISYSLPQFARRPKAQLNRDRSIICVRILAVFGNDENLDLARDRACIEALTHAETHILDQPSARQLIQTLRDPQGWDIFFFAGHSSTQRQQGRIDLNDRESLEINQFKNALTEALHNGLKVAIFNSCEGVGLAQDLADLQLPATIVMQEVVPDCVANHFLQEFLREYAQFQPLHAATRLARGRLEEFTELPGCTWLPLICQNPAEPTPQWRDLAPKPPSRNAVKPRKPLRRILQVLQISGAIALGIMTLRALGWLEPLELAAYDYLMRSRPPAVLDKRILVVEVTQADIDRYNGYPLEDAAIASLLARLTQHQPRAIGLDMHRYKPQGQGRSDLIAQIRQNPNIFLVCAFGSPEKNYRPPPEIPPEQHDRQLGFSDLMIDDLSAASGNLRADLALSNPSETTANIVRRQLLSYTPALNPSPSPCRTPYSFSFQLAFQYLYAEGIEPLTVNAEGQWQLGDVSFPKLPRRFGGYQHLDGLSNQIAINYRAAPPGQHVSAQSVISGEIPPELIKDRLILIGYTAPIAADEFYTPYGKMAGIWVHAHMTSQLLSAVLDERPLIWAFPLWLDGIWVLVWSSLGGFGVAIVAAFVSLRIRFVCLAIAIVSGLSLCLSLICFAVLIEGGWLAFVPAAMGLWFVALGVALDNWISTLE